MPISKKQQERDEYIVKMIVVLLHDNGFKKAAEFVAVTMTAPVILEQLRR